jgi:tetratricopeptide (TPR) repeat protein
MHGAELPGKVFCFGFLLALLSLAGCRTPEPQNEVNTDVAPLVEAGDRAVARADYGTAIASYRQAFQRTPWNTRLKRALAAAHAERAARSRDQAGLGGLRSAEEDLRAALALYPDDDQLQKNLAIVLVEQAAREADPVRAGAMREEARGFSPEVVEAVPVVQVRLERQLDLAHESIERGQLEAAITTLEGLLANHPEHAGVTILLARARVRQGSELAQRGDLAGAGAALDRAVELYASLDHCRAEACETAELEMAHQNRIRAWLYANRFENARRALLDAEAAGLSFPKLRESLPD